MNKSKAGAYMLYAIIGRTDVTYKLSQVRGRHFVYVLKKDGTPVYIGRTRDLLHRLYYHKYRKDFEDIHLLEYDKYETSKRAERRLIRYYKPEMNIYRGAKHN